MLALDMSRVPDIEYSALQALMESEKRATERGAVVWLVGLNPDVLESFDMPVSMRDLAASACCSMRARQSSTTTRCRPPAHPLAGNVVIQAAMASSYACVWAARIWSMKPLAAFDWNSRRE